MSAVLAMVVAPVYPARLPWRQIFDDMKERGCAYSKQAALIGVEWSTFQGWRSEDGCEPRHSQGVAILAMHTAVCGAELTAARLREGIVSV